jgi:hypothetical protein
MVTTLMKSDPPPVATTEPTEDTIRSDPTKDVHAVVAREDTRDGCFSFSWYMPRRMPSPSIATVIPDATTGPMGEADEYETDEVDDDTDDTPPPTSALVRWRAAAARIYPAMADSENLGIRILTRPRQKPTNKARTAPTYGGLA